MSPQDTAACRFWLQRCVAGLQSNPPTDARNMALSILNEQIEQTATNVIPFRRAT